MKNYIHRIALSDDKFAYHQAPSYRSMGVELILAIEAKWNSPRIFYHRRKGGHIAALVKHLSNEYFSVLDIDRYFYRINRNKIIKALKSIGFSFIDANEAAKSSVVKAETGFFLPYGFVQSPILASLCLDRSRCGEFLRTIRKEVCLSVYVDDILLSHPTNRSLLAEVSQELIEVFQLAGFPISEKRRHIAVESSVVFNMKFSKQSVEITPQRMNDFRDSIRENLSRDAVIDGITRYVKSVNIEQSDQLQLMVQQLKQTQSASL